MRALLIAAIVLVLLLGAVIGGFILMNNADFTGQVLGMSYTPTDYSFAEPIRVEPAAVTLVYVIASAVTLLLFFLILYSIMRGVVGLLIKNAPVFGETIGIRIAGFAAAAFVMPDVPYNFFGSLVVFPIHVLRTVPFQLYNLWQSAFYQCTYGAGDLGNCMGSIALPFIREWSDAISTAFDRTAFDNFRWERFIFFIAVWLVVGALLSALHPDEKETQPPDSRSWVNRAFAALRRLAERATTYVISHTPVGTGQNLMFFLLLGIGAYLSIAAIIAIPALQQEQADIEGISAETLSEQIDALKETFALPPAKNFADAQNPYYVLQSMYDPTLTEISTPLPTPEAESTAEATPEAQNEAVEFGGADQMLLENLERQSELHIRTFERWRQDLYDSAAQLHTDASGAINTYAGVIKSEYLVNTSSRPGQLENRAYYLRVVEWFQLQILALSRRINICYQSIDQFETSLTYWSGEAVRSYEESRFFPDFYSGIARFEIISADRYAELFNTYQDALASCRVSLLDEETPVRSQLGSEWGIFGQIAGPLLRTESMDLALLVGLVGFGLVGSTSSTFIRQWGTKAQTSQEPLNTADKANVIVAGLIGITIRGVTAAFVVFLGATAGLTIFAGEEAEPQPYAILLFCLVGAVFSERIWAWASGQLSEKFPGSTSTDNLIDPNLSDADANIVTDPAAGIDPAANIDATVDNAAST